MLYQVWMKSNVGREAGNTNDWKAQKRALLPAG
jgi:hypothetical protein